MGTENSASPSNPWLLWALLTVFSWGVYGVILHKGRGYMPMGPETPHAGLKAFLFVCLAYALIGVATIAMLKARGSNWSFTPAGIQWSAVAGVAGAVGAFALVLSLGAASQIYKGAAAAAVMPIVFAGAPVVNTIVAMALHPPEGGFKSLPLPFVLGCVMAACGAFLVAKFAPANTGAGAPKPAVVAPANLSAPK
jgi:drug/metabolite transporter (DMT)-like permease